MKTFFKGLLTGLFLQSALGPVLFYIIGMVLQKSLLDGIFATAAVTLVDYFYITLSILGIGKALKDGKAKKILSIISPIILIVFGSFLIYKAGTGMTTSNAATIDSDITSTSLLFSCTSTFLMTISSPMTIIFYTSLFSAKALEHNFTKRELWIFGMGVGLATFLFTGTAAVIFYMLKGVIPSPLVFAGNILVGIILVAYGTKRILKLKWQK